MNSLKVTPLREETIIHSLFGGNETKPKHHRVFSIEVSDLERSYVCSFEVLSEKKICGFISKMEDKRILNELKNKGIILSDPSCKETEIGLLIGADNIGKLLTGNLIELDSGLTAIETKLGWTVIGKLNSNVKNTMLTTSSLHVRNVSVKELWELDVLGITDPFLNENAKDNFDLTDFKNKMKILPDGRFEVTLPWKCNTTNLPSNKELTWKRHLRMTNNLKNGKFFDDYKKATIQKRISELIQKQNDNPMREPRVGEVVLIGDDNKKRLFWPIAKIIELIPGRDGEIRTVRLKTQHGSVIRPVQRIFPLEIQAIANNDKELKGESISVKCAKPENVLNTNDVIVKKYTSSGRLVKEPKRLDLLNYDCYRFETLPKSQRGEYML
ncbi:DUF5641 domain-containing protein [Nephila pilipes]|uniref:DUF5641 domain-containing protein n=1 Tax=Nephila pilipes TaxID=299642 RepID=A0A8X6UMJ0_NEPPI|nr:DUF5641 domain-containing protein [Nephila pilipes]